MNEAEFYRWTELTQTAMTPQITRRLVSGEKLMMVELTLAKGAVVGVHSHPHEQITHIVSGALEFEVHGEKRIVHSGEVILVPSHTSHGAVALADTVTLEAFSPPREDFLTGQKADYMK